MQAKYHEEFEKKIKGSKIEVADDPETQRLKQLSSILSQVEYKGLREKVLDMEARRQNVAQRKDIIFEVLLCCSEVFSVWWVLFHMVMFCNWDGFFKQFDIF